MALEDYRSKRDLGVTPEPAGGGAAASVTAPAARGRGAFVVQRHAARRLHYDLRLERDGVLASWAVPRGLPCAATEQHLAVQVEDHPLEYAQFEGVIPQGHYGAGEVHIWDHGTYEVTTWDGLPDSAVAFRLDGTIAQGEWRLFPAGLDGDPRNWLLTREDAAAPRAPRAVPAPMLAREAARPRGGQGWAHEVKWDGYRVIVRIEGQRSRVWTRGGSDVTERFGAVARALDAAVATPDCVLDGEVVALDSQGHPSFGLLQAGEGPLAIYVFDLLEEFGVSRCRDPWADRRDRLAQVIPAAGTDEVVRLSASFGDGPALLEHVRQAGLEGVMSKRRDSGYQPGRRSEAWVKVKVRGHDSLAIVGYRPIRGRAGGVGSLVLAHEEAGDLRWAGNCGSGISDDESAALEAELAPLAVDRPVLEVPPSLARQPGLTWVRPELQARVRFSDVTAAGRLRHAVFEGVRPVAANGRVPGTRRDKEMFPGEGITKGDLLDYYAAVAPRMLPALADRPLTLIRYPDGIGGPHFFQRNRPREMPDWIPSARVPLGAGPGAKVVDAPIVDSVDALLWLVNAGCIDINPWQSTVADLAHPDLLLFDLDAPDDGDLSDSAVAALLVRGVLEGAGIECGVRVSSLGGMHVLGRLPAGTDYATARKACRTVAKALEREHPGAVTTQWRKTERRGVLIDCNQVGWGKSISAAWSVRPRPGAPVALPLSWQEVERGIDPAMLTMGAAMRRASQQ